MNEDLKIIKKKYGEAMMQLCRKLFPSLLETEGLLSNLLLTHFHDSRFLYQDIIDKHYEEKFQSYIYGLIELPKEESVVVSKTPKELLDEAGYILYECHSEDDIDRFRDYYAKDEEICTFDTHRLERCYVFFAVKKDVDQIKREDFLNPKREDLYGTSVISIQFMKDRTNALSIKNRYNDTVDNPDATFRNNLDNIIPGLTEAFYQTYGLKERHIEEEFRLFGYVKANDGKYYKYNYCLNNIYYCPDNIIIDNFEVKEFAKEKYIVMDYFIIDLQERKIYDYDSKKFDTFPNTIFDIEKITVLNKDDGKEVIIVTKKGMVIIELNKYNQIKVYFNSFIEEIQDSFLQYNTTIEELSLPNTLKVGNNTLMLNKTLSKINMPKVKSIGKNFLQMNRAIQVISFPEVEEINNTFMNLNNTLQVVDMPNLNKVGMHFLTSAYQLKVINIPSNLEVGEGCNKLILEQLANREERNR